MSIRKRSANIHGRKRHRAISFLVAVCSALALTHFAAFPTHALPTGFQEYYVLGYEEHVWRAFDTIYDGSIPNQICSTIGLVATADYQVVYYDHWEDGYEADLLNPTQSSTEIYNLSVGASLSLTSTQTSGPTINQAIPIPRSQSSDPSNLRYDGGDRIITSGGPVALTHIMWPVNSSWAGGGWEVYSGQVYAETFTYHLPIGEDLYTFGGGDNGAYGDFRNVFLELGAFERDTVVSIDNGDQVVALSLDQGQTYSSQGYINSSSAPTVSINTSTVIRANRPIQVGLMTGADSPPEGFQSRFFMVMPDSHWGTDYVVPIPRGDNSTHNNRDVPAEVYLSNPNDFPITINAYDLFTQTTFSINPRTSISSTVSYSQTRGGFIPEDSAARFTSSDGPFGIVVCADTSETAFDWGFSGFPAKYLTQDYYVSWAPGNSCTPPDSLDCINGSPVWVTPLADSTTFYADFSPLDGVPDENFTLDSLEQRRIFDNVDNDNTGMHIWATGKFAVVWGEDPRTAGPSAPYLDLGLTTLPLRQTWLDPVLTIEATSEPTVLPPAGGTVTFTLVTQSYDLSIEDVAITNTLPVSWTYVSSSTHVTYPGGGMASPEPVTSDQILSWDLSAYLDANQSLTLTFQAQITDTETMSISISQSEAIGRDESTGTLFNPTDDTIVYISPVFLIKSVSASQAEIGDTLVYTTYYANRSTGTTVTNAILHDVVPIQHVVLQSYSSGGAYNPASSTITWALGSLSPGVSGTVAFTTTISEFVEDGTVIENRAFLSSQEIERAGSNTVRTTALAPDVRLVKAGPPVAHRGSTITYTLSYENIGGAQASGVTIQDIVPSSASYLTGTLSIFTGTEWVTLTEAEDDDQGAYISPTLTITPGVVPGTVPPGETGQIRFSVRTGTQLPSGSFVQNWATLDQDLANPRGTNMVVTRISDLLIGKRAHQAAVLPGNVITYTLTYTNVSLTNPQTKVYVREAIPGHTDLLTITEIGDAQVEYSWDNGTSWYPTRPITPVTHIRWYDAEVPTNTQGLLSFTVLVATTLPPGTIIDNTAYITSEKVAEDFQGWIPSNQVQVPTVDLWVQKSASQPTAQAGDAPSYTISYGNRGSADAVGVQILDTVPVGTDYVPSSIWGDGASADGAPHLLWDVGTVAAGASTQKVGYSAVLNGSVPPCGNITNTAVLSSSFGIETSGSVVVQVTGPANLTVNKLGNPSAVGSGETLTYTIAILNNGPGCATGVMVSDTLPAHTQFISNTIGVRPPGIGTLGAAPPILIGGMTITAGHRVTVTFAVTVTPPLPEGTVITNTASVASMYTPAPFTSTVTTTVHNPAFVLTKQANDGGSLPVQGSPFTYTLTITNTGMGVARNVVVTDALPAAATYVAGGSFISSSNTVSWTVAQVPPNDNAKVTFVVSTCEMSLTNAFYRVVTTTQQVASSLGPPLLTTLTPPTLQVGYVYAPLVIRVGSTVHLTSTSMSNGGPIVEWDWQFGDSTGGNGPTTSHAYADAGTYTVTLTITDSCGFADSRIQTLKVYDPDLFVEKKADPSTVRAGDLLTFPITIINASLGPLTGVTVTDTLPANTSFVTTTPPHTASAGNVITWTLGALDIESTRTITLVVRVDSSTLTGTAIVNTAWATSTESFSGTDTITTPVEVAADLIINKTSDPVGAKPGESLTYTLWITNSGPSDAQNVSVVDVLPDKVTYGGTVTTTLPFLGPTHTDHTLRWQSATLLPSVSGMIVFTVTVNADASDVLSNSVIITSTTADPKLGNNTADEKTYLIPEVDFSTPSYLVDESEGAAVVKVTLSVASGLPITVSYASADGTATADDDYAATSGTLHFPPLSTTQTFTVPIIDDLINEPDETVFLTLTGPTSATIGTDHNPATLIILDDDPLPIADFVASSFSVSETVSSAIITVNLSHPSSFPVAADYVSLDGTATVDDDYAAISGTLQFPPLSTTQTFTVPIIDDPADEPDETVFLTLTGATSATVGTGRNPATLIILDNDPLPIADFVTSSFSVSETVSSAIITVNLSHPSGLPVSVDYVSADGTATAGDDYAVTSGTLRFPPLSTTQALTVAIIDDPADEFDETVVLTLTAGTNAAVGTDHNPATLVILDDDPESAMIYGTVFLDTNGSGILDDGELGIPDVLVAIDAASLSVITTTTGSDGTYALYTPVEGVHTVIETDPRIERSLVTGEDQIAPMDVIDYISTTPNEVHLDVVFRNAYQVDFGDGLTNLGFAPIYGVVFEDTDGDGVQGPSELGLSGIVITLTSPSLEVFTTTTDIHGRYTLSTTTPGAHVVAAAEPSGYFATSPNEIHLDVTLGEAYQVNFGNAPVGSSFAAIYGTVFDDENGDGVYDKDETGIPSVLITLSAISRPAITITTDVHGSYTLSSDVAGPHTLVETDPDGYTSSTSNQVDLDVTLDAGYQADFGDLEASACAPDMYEEDDSANQARQFTVGTIQAHQFCDDAVDWIRFTARANSVYTITTHVRGRRADTILTLFDTDGQTEVAANDNYTETADLSSRIVWKVPTSGEYYARITNKNALIGQRTDYDLHIDADDLSTVYMPIVTRDS